MTNLTENEKNSGHHTHVHINQMQPQPKSRIAYILLGLFLGGFGVHNFYAGYGGKGAAQLLISLFIGWLILPILVVWIWIIIELITVDKDANGIPMT